ncbi:hypothetical protein SAMN06295888_103212 [Desulfonatronum zhilinae]|nr:hypothetical protein SAMN06295888_103212 [Desulfonatronum zhilinae]
MCGYCVENAALGLIEKEIVKNKPLDEDDLHGLVLEPFTQESRYALHNAQLGQSFEMLPEVLHILHCLALGELGGASGTEHGDSLVKAALAKHFHDYRHMLSTKFPGHVELLCLLPHPEWAMLYGQEMLFSQAKRQTFLSGPLLPGQCSGLLNAYHDWWLQGNGLCRNDQDQLLRDTGVYDPIPDITDQERDRLDMLFPALFFAVSFLAQSPKSLDSIRRIALNEPSATPLFNGLDLWLRRKALIFAIRNDGPGFLLDNLSRDFSPVLIRYAFMRLGPVRAIKTQLVDRLQSMIRTGEQRSEFDDQAQLCMDMISSWPSLTKYQ